MSRPGICRSDRVARGWLCGYMATSPPVQIGQPPLPSETSEPADSVAQRSGLVAAYETCRPDLLRMLTARMRNAADAEDVLQDLWLRIGHAVTGPVATPRAYLMRAALNLANDLSRSGARRQRRDAEWTTLTTTQYGASSIDEEPAADRVADGRRRAAALAAAIADLPKGAGEVFRRHRLNGESHADIAKALGISKSAVEKHMAVALRHLIEALPAEAEAGR